MTALRRLHPQRLSRFDVAQDLLPVDRIFQRWARSVGTDAPLPAWNGSESRPNALPEDAAVWVDRYVCARPPRMRKFLHAWYRSQHASAVIARRFSVGRDQVYLLWRGYLAAARCDFLREPCVARMMRGADLTLGARAVIR